MNQGANRNASILNGFKNTIKSTEPLYLNTVCSYSNTGYVILPSIGLSWAFKHITEQKPSYLYAQN